MMKWALGFLVLALVAAIFGFGGVAAVATDVAQLLFFAFIILFIAALVFGAVRKPTV